MAVIPLLWLMLFCWSVREVYYQPYVSFNGQTLANHAYVYLSLVGRPDPDGGEGVQRITDLESCCTGSDGIHRGDWYFPDGTRLPFPAPNVDTFETRVSRGVDIRRNTNAN